MYHIIRFALTARRNVDGVRRFAVKWRRFERPETRSDLWLCPSKRGSDREGWALLYHANGLPLSLSEVLQVNLFVSVIFCPSDSISAFDVCKSISSWATAVLMQREIFRFRRRSGYLVSTLTGVLRAIRNY